MGTGAILKRADVSPATGHIFKGTVTKQGACRRGCKLTTART